MAKQGDLTQSKGSVPAQMDQHHWDDPWDDRVDQTSGDILPAVKIAYAESRDKPDDCPVGQLYNQATGETFKDGVRFLWLATRMSGGWKPKYSPGEKEQKPAYCVSCDGVNPSGGVRMQAGPCRKLINGQWVAVCPKLAWTPDPNNPGRDLPPECADYYTMLCWDLGSSQAFVYAIKRTGVKWFRRLKTAVKTSKAKMMHPTASMPPTMATPIKMTTFAEKTWYSPKFEIDWDAPKTDPAYAALVAQMLPDLLRSLKTAATRAVEEEAAVDAVVDARFDD